MLAKKHKRPLPEKADLPRPGLATLALAVFLIGIALIIPATRAGAESVDALDAQITEARAQAGALAARVQASSEAVGAARQRADAAAARESELAVLVAKGRERSTELEAKLERARTRLAAVRLRFDRSRRALSERLVAIYTSGSTDEFSILLDSKGFDDLATRAELLGRIQAADSALVERVRSLRSQVNQRVGTVATARDQAEAFTARVDAARGQIAAVRAGAEAQASRLASVRSRQASALAGLRTNMADWAAQVRRAERISAQQAQREVSDWVGDWAIPSGIVQCESGGNFHAVNPSSGAGGAYQILPSTWELYGGHGAPQDASPQQQSEIAAQIWADSGSSAWECAG